MEAQLKPIELSKLTARMQANFSFIAQLLDMYRPSLGYGESFRTPTSTPELQGSIVEQDCDDRLLGGRSKEQPDWFGC